MSVRGLYMIEANISRLASFMLKGCGTAVLQWPLKSRIEAEATLTTTMDLSLRLHSEVRNGKEWKEV